ncbi:MAG: thiamine pyrophosphate-binding protein [Acidimicrobiia bacterium]|jgi:thiamine pyrophosphate-dependent acetolactate synthase large subunit-like protein/nitrite reductase/ring-hydroxylating ferredoxin subunit
MSERPTTTWHKVADLDELPEGRVKTVTVGRRWLALTHHQGSYGVLDNRCPHQGGPLGEGSIEKGWLRCPWHGYDYNPLDGSPPAGFDDAPTCFQTEVREDGVYVALPPESERVRTVSDVLVETMVNWGVTHVFGMVGHSNLGFSDAMREAEERGDLTFVGVRHEGAASFAASAYGKVTGELAACFGIAGPGSTNLMTGLYDAKVDRAPVLAISGQVPSKVKGRGAFQDLDLEAAFSDVARYSETVLPGGDYAELMNMACKHSLVERDVTHLMLPDEVQVIPSDTLPGQREGRISSRAIAPPDDVLDAAVRQISQAERPLFIVGAGARHDMGPIVDCAEKMGIPVVTTFKAKGQIPDTHPLGCGVLGRSGTPVASWFMNESDLLVVFGASFSNHTGIADYKPTIQVDSDPLALGRFHPVDIPVQGDVGVTARLFAERMPADTMFSDRSNEVAERWGIWREEKKSRRADDSGEGVNSAAIFDSLSRLAPPDAAMAVDVGNNTYSFGRYFEAERQSIVMSGYLGSIGFAFPAAMGLWAAVGGERQVIAVAGDGGFGQYAMEFNTAVKHDMDITLILLVNDELGKISKEQRGVAFDVWQTELTNPDFAEFARNCGGFGVRVGKVDELDDGVSAGLAHRGPAIVQIDADPLLV